MSGNSIGRNFVLSTFGESHGIAIGGMIDGCPAGITLDVSAIQTELDRRKPGTNRHVTARRESDTVQILSGVFEGKTTGTPIGFLIANEDQRSQDYAAMKDSFRPGHADYAYWHKYGVRDYRGGGRASARETAARVVGGAVAKAVLEQLSVGRVRAYVSQIGEHRLNFSAWEHVHSNPFFCPNTHQLTLLEHYLYAIRKEGDSIGAEVTLVIDGLLVGLGEPVFDRLDADLGHAMMSINAVKGVAIGDGFDCVAQRGSSFRDQRNVSDGFLSNHAGGILGGISTGQEVVVRVAFKPTSSILVSGQSTNIHHQDIEIVSKGRHDPCVGLRACPIVEAMAAMVVCDHFIRQRGQNNR